jgi:adenylosuccinate synthase
MKARARSLKLCKKFNASLVVRYSGGCQCAHHVMGPKTFHPFAQFGSGTFAGVPTYLGAQVIIDPLAIAYEASGLSWQGVESPIRLLQINPRCLVTTPLHAYANREFDKACKHGTCGRGIGMTRNMWLNYGTWCCDRCRRPSVRRVLREARVPASEDPILDWAP